MEKPPNIGFMAKDFDGNLHVKNQKNNFDELIKQARQRKAVVTQEAPEAEGDGTATSREDGTTTSAQASVADVPREDTTTALSDGQQAPVATTDSLKPSTAEIGASPSKKNLGLQNDPFSTGEPVTGRFFV
jgi:hypothetical protein